MSDGIFRFKHFEIRQDNCAMKVGTDGVLLGAWAPLHRAHRILDIGAGTGLLSLMAAQRNANALIDAVEIDPDAADQAAANFFHSPWKDRLRLYCCPIERFAHRDNADLQPCRPLAFTSSVMMAAQMPTGTCVAYDFIISNPPFHPEHILSADPRRLMARSASALPFSVLFESVSTLITADGVFALIFPTQAEEAVQMAAVMQRMHCLRRCAVKTVGRKPAKRVMALYGKTPPADFVRETLHIHGDGGSYSDEYLSLTQDFYLHL